ncbi:MAG: class I SAM-dependent methyltransferase [Bacteroidia bacterium]|nr:class I SAM-dependent methyltransferase [Bacteroidia bacterium]
MDKDFEKKYHHFEEKQWWFTTRRVAIHNLLNPFIKPGIRVLDIGCSGGVLIHELQSRYSAIEVHGIDVSEEAVKKCKERGLSHIYCMDATTPQLENSYYDIIIASDCLEHIADDRMALTNWFHLLKPGGIALVFVPAFSALWSKHDELNHHYRRYTRTELLTNLQQAGLHPAKNGYWNVALFFPAIVIQFLSKLIRYKKNVHKNIHAPSPFVNRLLITWLNIENSLLGKVRYPVGISTWCLARKPLI